MRAGLSTSGLHSIERGAVGPAPPHHHPLTDLLLRQGDLLPRPPVPHVQQAVDNVVQDRVLLQWGARERDQAPAGGDGLGPCDGGGPPVTPAPWLLLFPRRLRLVRVPLGRGALRGRVCRGGRGDGLFLEARMGRSFLQTAAKFGKLCPLPSCHSNGANVLLVLYMKRW